ncbi:MAG: LysM peptidoglycan-binding domain-containing protein [Gaiellaceae bacterium]
MRSGRRPAGRRLSRRRHAGPVARYGAPAAFLLAATVAVLLIHSGLGGRTTPVGPATTAATTTASTTTGGAAKPKPKPRPAGRFYVIQRGETFSIVAARFKTTVQRLEGLNPGVSSNALRVGQRIRVG